MIIAVSSFHIMQPCFPVNAANEISYGYTRTRDKRLSSNSDLSGKILSYFQLHEPLLFLDDQALLVGQMQETNETVTGRDIVHCLSGIDALQVLHHGCEFQTTICTLLWLRLGSGQSSRSLRRYTLLFISSGI